MNPIFIIKNASNAIKIQFNGSSEKLASNMLCYQYQVEEPVQVYTPGQQRAIVKCGVWRSRSSLLMSLHFFHSIDEANIFHYICEEFKTS